ncbi:hypothetical protein CRE_29317 [Caenorhabditis remanei]|uniref:Uncharacterized protein n=1 Tax=Caenorhabditis remanei TaxID=31234 RepID=E3MY39_CAERE|nr:hypothetical protein CRE_29317 [Caenorhabditis remanei]
MSRSGSTQKSRKKWSCVCHSQENPNGARVLIRNIFTVSTLTSSNTTKPSFDICLPRREFELLSNDILAGSMVDFYNWKLLDNAHRAIGIRELREVLGFDFSVEWTNGCRPTRDDLHATSTIEEYYELSEARKRFSAIKTDHFFEKQLLRGIEFLDNWVPAVRTMYRQKFEKFRGRPEAPLVLDREEIGDMLDDEYGDVEEKVQREITMMRIKTKWCQEDVERKIKKSETTSKRIVE